MNLEPGNLELLTAFASDTSAAGKAVEELLKDLDAEGGEAVPAALKEKAASLVSRLPSLMPDDPAMAAVLAEAMANEFGTVPSASSPTGADKEITQADAERIYEEMMK